MIPPFKHDWHTGVRQGGKMNVEAMNQNLLDFKEVLDKYEIPFVLVGGALLGLIRESKLIEYDTDIDIICFNENTRHDPCKMRWVKNELENKGFYIVDSSRCRCKTDFFIRNGERIDIFWLDKIDNEWIFNNELRWPSYFFDTKHYITYLNNTFIIPYQPETFLWYTYGKDWKTPKENCHPRNLNPKTLDFNQ